MLVINPNTDLMGEEHSAYAEEACTTLTFTCKYRPSLRLTFHLFIKFCSREFRVGLAAKFIPGSFIVPIESGMRNNCRISLLDKLTMLLPQLETTNVETSTSARPETVRVMTSVELFPPPNSAYDSSSVVWVPSPRSRDMMVAFCELFIEMNLVVEAEKADGGV